jgi:hypothetical protein
MAKSDSELKRLLPQRAFAAFCKLHNFNDRRFRLRMSAQLFHVSPGVFATHDGLLCLLGHSLLLILWSALLAHTSTRTIIIEAATSSVQ